MAFILTERALYKPLSNYLSTLGCDSTEEVHAETYPDLLVGVNGSQFVVEAKIGKQDFFKGIAQLESHARNIGTDQKLLLVYPEKVRARFARPDDKRISRIALDIPLLEALVLIEDLTESYKGKTAKYVLKKAVTAATKKSKIYNPELTLKALTKSVQVLANELRGWDEIAKLESEVVGRMELFTTLGSESGVDKGEFRAASIDLSAYILVNQLLFYRIFSERTNKVPHLTTSLTKRALENNFKKILKIDFVPIFRVKILPHIPEKSNIEIVIRQVVNVINALKPEKMEHNLMGRIFHDLLPRETQKILAAFYTRPVAAELISGLSVKKAHDKVIDPACGSGTLLVSAYWRKRRLVNPREKKVHKKFLEKEITGIDIMPFASHLTAVNLAAQDVDEITNDLRIGCQDSLTIQAGSILQNHDWQLSLLDTDKELTKVNVTESTKNEGFELGKVDTVIMNPPFTKQKRLPTDYHKSVLNRWGNLTGGRIGLWGSFIFMADNILKPNGRIGAVIPINILRGELTRRIRNFLLAGTYTWKYILRSTNNYAFSESSEYSDIILVVEKTPPKPSDLFGVVLIQKNLKDFSLQEARMIADRIKTIKPGSNHEEKLFEIYWEKHIWLDQHLDNMMPLVSVGSIKSKRILDTFNNKIISSPKTKKFTANQFSEGFRPVPKGLSELVFITRPEPKQRAMYANIILKKELKSKQKVKGTSKTGLDILIPKKYLLDTLRTPVGLETMDISRVLDYLIMTPYKELPTVKSYSNYTGKINWDNIQLTALKTKTQLTICRRINPYSPSQKHLSFYSSKFYYPSNQMEVVHEEGDRAKIMCLFFNSTAFFAQFLTHKEESTGRRVDIRVSDLVSMYGFDYDKLTNKDKKLLLKTFDEISTKVFPSIMEQYKDGHTLRRRIDEAVFAVIGLKKSTIKKMLNDLYQTIYEEMVRIRSFSRD